MGRAKGLSAASATAVTRGSQTQASPKLHTFQMISEAAEQRIQPMLVSRRSSWDNQGKDLRKALGLSVTEPLELHIVFDRSGSVFADSDINFDQQEIAEQAMSLEEAGNNGLNRVALSGFDGFDSVSNIYEIKPAGQKLDKVLYYMNQLGGGSTPTADGVAYAASNFQGDSIAQVIVVVTDGVPNNPAASNQAIEEARSQGIQVVGAIQTVPGYHIGYNEDIGQQFGEGNWFNIQDAKKFDVELTSHIAQINGVSIARDERMPSDARTTATRLAQSILQVNKDKRKFRLDVVVDRSGSVFAYPDDQEAQQEMVRIFAGLDEETDGQVPTSIYGFDGDGYAGAYTTNEYSFKEVGEYENDRIANMRSTGGGGTSVSYAVASSRKRLTSSAEENKIMAVIIDGDANNPNEALREIEQARAEGTMVMGLVYDSPAFGALPERKCDAIFGKGHWRRIVSYTDAPAAVANLIAKASSLPA